MNIEEIGTKYISFITKLLSFEGWTPFPKLQIKANDANIRMVEALEDKQLIEVTLTTKPLCPQCKSRIIFEKLGDIIYCQSCNKIFDLSKRKEKYIFSTINPSKKGICEFLRRFFQLDKIQNENALIIKNTWIIGELQQSKTVVLLSIGKTVEEKVFTAIGKLQNERKQGILLHCDKLDTTIKEAFEKNPQFILVPVELIRDIGIVCGILQNIDDKYSHLNRIKQLGITVMGDDYFAKYPTREEGWVDRLKLSALSYDGKYQFEEPAISLLCTLGVPIYLEHSKNKAEGLLLQPDGFWIIDAKSCQKPYKFRIEARDQIKRYVDSFRRVQKHPAMKCKGIGIIAREISQQTINQVKTYFDNNEMEGRLFIGLVNPLIELLLAVQRNPEFWNRYSVAIHPQMLLEGEKGLQEEYRKTRARYKLQDTKMLVIDEELITSYYERVMSDNLMEFSYMLGLKSPVEAILRMLE